MEDFLRFCITGGKRTRLYLAVFTFLVTLKDVMLCRDISGFFALPNVLLFTHFKQILYLPLPNVLFPLIPLYTWFLLVTGGEIRC